jgi:hypothetical protein
MLTTCPATRLIKPRQCGFTEAAFADMRSGVFSVEAVHFLQQQTDGLIAGDWLAIKGAL